MMFDEMLEIELSSFGIMAWPPFPSLGGVSEL